MPKSLVEQVEEKYWMTLVEKITKDNRLNGVSNLRLEIQGAEAVSGLGSKEKGYTIYGASFCGGQINTIIAQGNLPIYPSFFVTGLTILVEAATGTEIISALNKKAGKETTVYVSFYGVTGAKHEEDPENSRDFKMGLMVIGFSTSIMMSGNLTWMVISLIVSGTNPQLTAKTGGPTDKQGSVVSKIPIVTKSG